MNTILKNILLLTITIVTSLLMANFFGEWYGNIFSDPLGSFVDLTFFVGIVPSYLLFATFIFSVWGDKHKHWIILILSIPALLFIIYFDLQRLWFYFAIALIGIIFGEILRNLLLKNKQQ